MKISKTKLNVAISFIILLVPNIIMWIVYFPGYFQCDHQATIASIINGRPSEWHSLVWGYIFYIGVLIFKSYNFAGFVQSFIFAIFTIIGIYNLKKYSIIKHYWPFCLIMALFPTFLLYNQLYCSDIIFAYSVFTLTCLLICYVKTYLSNSSIKNKNENKKNLKKNLLYFKKIFSTSKDFRILFILIITFTLIACLMRKNAVLIPLLLALMIFLFFRKQIWGKFLIFGSFIILLFSFMIPTTLDIMVGAAKSPSQEMLSVPCVQIAAAYKKGIVSEECRQIFEKYRSAENWVKEYTVTSADGVKEGVELNPEFIIAWFKTGINNKKIFLSAHWYLISGFIDFGELGLLDYGPSGAYEKNNTFNGTPFDFSQIDIFTTLNLQNNNDFTNAYLSHFNIKHSEKWYELSTYYTENAVSKYGIIDLIFRGILFNRGLPFWVLLIAGIFAVRKNFLKEYLIISAPFIAILISLLFFAPVCLFRYSITLYYALFVIIMMMIKYKKLTNLDNNNNNNCDSKAKMS